MLHFVTLWWLRESTLELDRLAEMMVELLWSGLGGDRDVQEPRPRRARRR